MDPQIETVAKSAVDLSPWALFVEADIVVKLVIFGLLGASIWSWAIIIERSRRLKALNVQAKAFEDWFWKSDGVDAIVDVASRNSHPSAKLFTAGMAEWRTSLKEPRVDRDALRARIASATQVSITREIDAISDRLNILATIGSVAPFVGLFGTVWGIMRSFTSIAASQNTTLAVVAPGIAEALFATAIGLFAAIPAVIGYNRLLHNVGRLEARLMTFADEFHALLSRMLDAMGPH